MVFDLVNRLIRIIVNPAIDILPFRLLHQRETLERNQPK